MAVSFRAIRNASLSVVLLAIPLLLLRGATLGPQPMGAFDRAIRRMGAPLEAGVSYAAGMLGAFFERWMLQARLQDENEELRAENRNLRKRLRELVKLQEDNRQLRRSLQLRESVPEDLLSAEVTGVDQSPFFRVVKIRVGRGDRYLGRGMAVLSPDGVVGRIDQTFDDYSDVMLITDPRSKIAVEIARTRAQGILEGASEDSCAVEISKDFEVEVGDLVQTSGVDELFPKGHPVGQVVRVRQLVGDQQLVEVLPAVRFDRLDVVWVVLASAPAPDPGADRPGHAPHAVGLQPIR
jgi:rod shape-determining protein MreC